MNQRECELVIAIAREGSISRAAAKMYMSQPALSLFLTRLESALGARLFVRTANGLKPTYAGERYIRTAEKIVKLCGDFEVEMCEISRMHRGRVHVGATVHLGSYVFPLLLPKYRECYPNIEVLITEKRSSGLEQALAHNEIDIALMHMPFSGVEADYEVIAEDPFVLVVAKDSPAAEHIYEKNGELYLDPRSCSGEKFVLAYPTQRVRQVSDRILAQAGIVPDISFMTSSVETAMRVASVGIGLTLMPRSYISLFTCPRTPYFCRIEEQYDASWTFVAAYPRDSELSNPAREMIRILKEIYHGINRI